MLKFKKGDKVKVLAGKDKGREGIIEKIYPRKLSAVVSGVNLYKRHIKPLPGKKGGIYELPRPLPFSKIGLICPKCAKTTRVSIKFIDNQKVRVCKKCKRSIDDKS